LGNGTAHDLSDQSAAFSVLFSIKEEPSEFRLSVSDHLKTAGNELIVNVGRGADVIPKIWSHLHLVPTVEKAPGATPLVLVSFRTRAVGNADEGVYRFWRHHRMNSQDPSLGGASLLIA